MKPALTLVAFLLAPLMGQESTLLPVRMKDGRTENIVPLALNGELARFKVFVLGGEMTISRKLSEFEPESAFRFEVLATRPQTFAAHFELAKKAVAMDLLPQAGAEARKAIESLQGTPEVDARTAEVRAWAADTLEAKLDAAIQAKNLATAKHLLKLLTTRLADQRSDEQLQALADRVEVLADAVAESQQAARQAKLAAAARDVIQRRLKPIRERIAQGDKQQKDAIAQSRSTVKSTRLCEQSIESYKAAWKSTQDLAAKFPDDADLAEEVSALGHRLQDSAIRSALHAANMLTVQSDYKGAMDWTTRILALDPDNAEAKEMMRTIQLASAAASSNWGWGWSVVGGVDPRRRY